LARVRAEKLKQSWETLQVALDELGQQESDLYTTIDGPTKERDGPGEHIAKGSFSSAYQTPPENVPQSPNPCHSPATSSVLPWNSPPVS
jgi:hypothetical protein